MSFRNAHLLEDDWHARVRRLLQLHQSQHAEKLTRSRLIEHPRDAGAQELLAWALYQQRRYQEGKVAATAAVTLAPMRSSTHYILSLAELALAQLTSAFVSIHEALRLDPMVAAYHGIHAAICYQLGSAEQALWATETGLSLDATEDNCLRWRIKSLIALGRTAEAEIVGRQQLQQNPNSAQAHLNLAQLALQRFHYATAEVHSRAALRERPQLEDAHTVLKEVTKCRYWLYRISRPTYQRFIQYIRQIDSPTVPFGGRLERVAVTVVLFHFLNLLNLYGSIRYRLDTQASATLGKARPDAWLYSCLLWSLGCIAAALLWFPMPLWAGLGLVSIGLCCSLGRWYNLRRSHTGPAKPWVTMVLSFPAAYIFFLATDKPIGGNIFLVFFGLMLFFLPVLTAGD